MVPNSGGIGTFTLRTLPCGTDYEERALRYFVPALTDLAGLDVVIVGGGDSAVDWALSLQLLARSVTVVLRRSHFRPHAHNITLMEGSDRIGLVLDAQVVALSGEPKVERAHVQVKGAGTFR